MIRIDDRAGSAFSGSYSFPKMLKRLGAPVKIKRLKFGDFAFYGNGPGGGRVKVGIERKTVSEMLGAVRDNRFTGHQLPGLLKNFDFVFLVVEGYTTVDPMSGILMQGKWSAGYGGARHLYSNLMKFQLTLMLKGGRLWVVPTKNKTETAYFIRTVYDWFTKKWGDHKSLYHVEERKPDRAIFDQRTGKRRVFNQLPGVDWVRSGMADRHFSSVVEGVTAGVDEWNAALGIKKGRKTATRIREFCYGDDDGKGNKDNAASEERLLRNPTPLRHGAAKGDRARGRGV